MKVYYKVMNVKNEQVGNIFIDNNNKIIITNKSFKNEYNCMKEVFEYTKENKLHIIDMQGNLYSKTLHDEALKKMQLFGFGYF